VEERQWSAMAVIAACARTGWRGRGRAVRASGKLGTELGECPGAPPSNKAQGHASEKRTRGAHGGGSRVHGRHALRHASAFVAFQRTPGE
jgi:hypothetical protein